ARVRSARRGRRYNARAATAWAGWRSEAGRSRGCRRLLRDLGMEFRMTISRKRWKRLAWWAALAVFFWLLSSFVVAYRLTRRPHAPFDEPIPELAWGKIQGFRLPTADGEELGAWFIPGRADRPVVLLLHGNGSCRSGFVTQAEIVAAEGCGALLISL